MSSADTPTSATSGPNAAATARSSGISATHGTHHVAQMLTTRSFAEEGKTSLIFAGSLTSRRFAAEAVLAIASKSGRMALFIRRFAPGGGGEGPSPRFVSVDMALIVPGR